MSCNFFFEKCEVGQLYEKCEVGQLYEKCEVGQLYEQKDWKTTKITKKWCLFNGDYLTKH